jgi:hypothetical protein
LEIINMAQQRQTPNGQRKESPDALIERARRVLLHEQRTGHADAAVRPGGLSSFIAYWGNG